MTIPCPINAIELPGVPRLDLKGLIVIVGPNSSGKTQLLRDINDVVCGRHRELVVASGVSFSAPPPPDDYLSLLYVC